MISYIAGVLELIGIYILGNKNRYGFLLNIIGNVLWVTVGIMNPGARGLLIVCIPLFFINIINFRKWGNDEKI